MSVLSELFAVDRIILDVAMKDKEEALQIASASFDILTQGLIYAVLLKREEKGSTGVGEGVAIPHARLKGLQKPLATFIRCAHPIQYEALDDRPVDMIFALLGPDCKPAVFLSIWAEVVGFFSDHYCRTQLRTLPTALDILSFIQNWQPGNDQRVPPHSGTL